ncbi:MAG: hypothetical protein AAFR68_16625 [Pseudomonadota bacterium]
MLNPASKDLLLYICAYLDEHGFAPTVSEMAEAQGAGRAQVHALLKQLEERFYIKRIHRRPRAIQVISRPPGTIVDSLKSLTSELRTSAVTPTQAADRIDEILRKQRRVA